MKVHEIITELTFFGSQCTDQCQGHMAGYKWKSKNPSRTSNSPSQSFNNGANISDTHRSQGRKPISTGIRGAKGRYVKFKPSDK